jgi:hypothetical protein
MTGQPNIYYDVDANGFDLNTVKVTDVIQAEVTDVDLDDKGNIRVSLQVMDVL